MTDQTATTSVGRSSNPYPCPATLLVQPLDRADRRNRATSSAKKIIARFKLRESLSLLLSFMN
jgi:hypothetical protein